MTDLKTAKRVLTLATVALGVGLGAGINTFVMVGFQRSSKDHKQEAYSEAGKVYREHALQDLDARLNSNQMEFATYSDQRTALLELDSDGILKLIPSSHDAQAKELLSTADDYKKSEKAYSIAGSVSSAVSLPSAVLGCMMVASVKKKYKEEESE